MGLNKSKGNMYSFVTHTWNTIKGKCLHDCSYCYMKRITNLGEIHFDRSELSTDLGKGNVIFVGSSCDMFAADVADEWIQASLDHCFKYDNWYLFQSKNPGRFAEFSFPPKTLVCTTIETNRHYPDVMRNSPSVEQRIAAMETLQMKKLVTIEPIMDFDHEDLVELIRRCNPYQVTIGADSGNKGLPEPSKEKTLKLVDDLKKFTKISQKRNLTRLL